MPGFVVAHGGVGDALEHMAGEAEIPEDLGREFAGGLGELLLHAKINAVDVFPHFRGNRLSNRAGVLSRGEQTAQNGIRIVTVLRQEGNDGFLGGFAIAFLKQRGLATGINQRLPLVAVQWQIQLQVEVHLEEPGEVFRAFHVAGHPIEGIRNPAEKRTGVSCHCRLRPEPKYLCCRHPARS